MKQFKGGKALDGYLIKTASRVILPALLLILNMSFKERQFMDRWKVEMVGPHFKKGSRHLLDGYLIKTASRVILPALQHILNLYIKERQFIDRWMVEMVVPHFKKGSRHLLDNYRPVRHLI